MDGVNVSVVIVNYNTLKMTNECIESLHKFTKDTVVEIVLVDNASTDGSKDFFSNDKRIRYLYLEENIGFGRANNVGAEVSYGKYIFLLNSDTILLDDVISKLFNFAEKHLKDDLGAVGTCLINSNKEDALSFGQFVTSKRIYRRLLETFKIYKNKFELETYAKLNEKGFLEVDFVSGADLFIPKTVFNKINGFDHDFFMYYEETDLQKRMSKLNLKRYIINVRDIIHLEGGSFEEKLPFRRKMMMTKGMKLYINKHFKGIYKFQIIILSFLILLKDLFKLNYTVSQKISLIREVFK
ncbi:glycosyltransferase family 2 protein [Flavobacterium procerum]|uniref:Glycosyltransferase family 2 protein n=1 Tax=Flavobacterium procerum TaxID=1455569 RepID=A0ABV6BU14_9FLAO